MSEANVNPPAESATRVPTAAVAIGGVVARGLAMPQAVTSDDVRFRQGLLIAALVHILLFASFLGAEPQRLGTEGGAENAISVEFVPDPDPASTATVADRAAGQPIPPPPPPQQQTAPEQRPPAEATPPPASPPPPAETASEPPAESAPAQTAAAPQQVEDAPDPVPALRPTLTTPEPASPAPEAKPSRKSEKETAEPQTKPVKTPEKTPPKPPEKTPEKAAEKPPEKAAKPKPKPAEPRPATPPQQQQIAKLDMTPPSSPPIAVSVGNGGAGLDRPPGITRSGLNDEFARGVIRALQRTMPQISTMGRVTVKITLDMSGNLVETVVMRPSSVAGLDQAVVFATRQSSFPLPPGNSKPVDLIFFVTYIYR